MGSLETLVLVMQLFSLFIVAAGAYLCLVHVGLLPAKPAMGGFAIAASCVLFGVALGALALTLSMGSAPVEAAEFAEPALPLIAADTVVQPPAAPSLLGDADFRIYEYH